MIEMTWGRSYLPITIHERPHFSGTRCARYVRYPTHRAFFVAAMTLRERNVPIRFPFPSAIGCPLRDKQRIGSDAASQRPRDTSLPRETVAS